MPQDILKIIKILKRSYPEAKCSLVHQNPFQLLVSTILSAQCTDKKVNEVTPKLFAKYPDAQRLAKAPQERIEKIIHSTGFYRQKAKSLKSMSEDLVANYDGCVPSKMEQLVKLRGVGRKTANVVLGNAFGKPGGVVVDTHVGRISRLLGLSKHKDSEKVEKDLNKIIPKKDWVIFSHLLIEHGRQVCISGRPKCSVCPLESLCPKLGLRSQ
ncbi:MAG: endonuclease III [Deltaproteobacteria bacterium CG11_big_fil_rev_8_21_14_0_20_45_16]|nr:MAG: endonuclease III [Deltaproteobacteria bacterium CG11_big_fil_rev_8_21_14_0_20_45_16]